ncbi:MAG TPA: nitroreductase family protein [Streptosporangiaceae bacterium]|nr:nitroreductase family protein [Streptosporangiaceae bacterium]
MTVLPLTPDELLTTTRSVRKRLDLTRPVPMELVRECLRIALQAPSGGNRQPWHWLVITDPETRAGIGELYRRSTEKYLAAQQKAAEAAGALVPGSPEAEVQRRIRDSAAYLGEHMKDVPVQVIACIEVDQPWRPGQNQAGLWGSLLPAAWSYMLACRSRKLGTAWTTLHLAYEKEAAEILGLPDHVRQGVLIPTAYYTGETFRPAWRRPLDEVLHLDHW